MSDPTNFSVYCVILPAAVLSTGSPVYFWWLYVELSRLYFQLSLTQAGPQALWKTREIISDSEKVFFRQKDQEIMNMSLSFLSAAHVTFKTGKNIFEEVLCGSKKTKLK